jgi:hypothetical protein
MDEYDNGFIDIIIGYLYMVIDRNIITFKSLGLSINRFIPLSLYFYT